MSHYLCIRCGYSSTHKGTFLRHLGRVKPCKPKLEKYNRRSIYEYNKLTIPSQPKSTEKSTEEFSKGKKVSRVSRAVSRLTRLTADPVSRKSADWVDQVVENDSGDKVTKINLENMNSYNIGLTCKLCGRKFQHKQSKHRHEKSRCKFINKGNRKIIKEQEEELQQKDRLLEEKNRLIEELLKQNIIINKNNEDDYSILSYNKTNKKFLTDEMISKCMEKQNMCVPEMIKLVHFNNIHPENRNIYISNLKTNYVMVYDGEKWIVQNRDQMLDKLISDNEKFMHKKIGEWYEESDNAKYKRAMKKFQKYLNVNTNTNLIDNIKDELKLMFYNNRDNNRDKNKNKNILDGYIVTEIK